MDISKKTLTCERAQDMMFLYIECELNAVDAARLSAHLKECEVCRKELEERKRILRSLGECEFTPPSSLKSKVMDKISDVPQERVHPIRRFIRVGAISGVAAAVMIFAVCRVFIFGGSVNDTAFDGAKLAPECEEVLASGNAIPTELGGVNTVYGASADADAVYFAADMAEAADVADCAEAVPETAAKTVEIYTVTSSIVAASPGVGLIPEPQYSVKVNSTVTAQTAAPAAADKADITGASAEASPVQGLFEKIRASDRAVIVCDSFRGVIPEKAASEEIVVFEGAEFLHLTFTENTGTLYTEILALLENESAFYCASAPKGEFEQLDLFFTVDSDK